MISSNYRKHSSVVTSTVNRGVVDLSSLLAANLGMYQLDQEHETRLNTGIGHSNRVRIRIMVVSNYCGYLYVGALC